MSQIHCNRGDFPLFFSASMFTRSRASVVVNARVCERQKWRRKKMKRKFKSLMKFRIQSVRWKRTRNVTSLAVLQRVGVECENSSLCAASSSMTRDKWRVIASHPLTMMRSFVARWCLPIVWILSMSSPSTLFLPTRRAIYDFSSGREKRGVGKPALSALLIARCIRQWENSLSSHRQKQS